MKHLHLSTIPVILLLGIILTGTYAEEPTSQEALTTPTPQPSPKEAAPKRQVTDASTKLADEQDELQADLMDLISTQSDAKVIKLLKRCQKATNDAVDLLEVGNTGGQTIAAQTEVIELIYKATKQMNSDSQGNPKPGTNTMMTMMERMLGMEQQAKNSRALTAGNGTGGEGAYEGSPNTEAVEAIDTQSTSKERTVPKSTGSGVTEMPEEFREVMDAYNKTLQ
jgi:hypothetical protein